MQHVAREGWYNILVCYRPGEVCTAVVAEGRVRRVPSKVVTDSG